jgi:aspartyl-tRNA(Asn)/glutamyl-tRNA(Gln) amidotransferase subunit C
VADIDRAEIARIARLSRLELDAPSLDAMTAHMKNMLELVKSLDSYDRKDASPRVHGLETEGTHLRPDVVTPSLTRDEALANAPEKGPDGFRVPAVLE